MARIADDTARPPNPPPSKDMVWIPGGSFLMGSNDFYPEERPVHRVEVDGLWMDHHPVTVAEFRRFVKATDYVTVAERPLDPAIYPDADPDLLVPGALVFHATPGPVDLDDYRNWWSYVPGASWRHPEGPRSTLHGCERHPVTQAAFEDAEAYAAWSGKELPSEGRVGVCRARRPGGQGVRLGRRALPEGQGHGQHVAGRVPVAEPADRRARARVARRGLPAERLRAGRHGGRRLGVDERFLHAEPSGRARARLLRSEEPACPRDPREPRPRDDRAPRHQGRIAPVRAELLPALPTARQGEAVDTSTGHIGFRCVVRA